jgi:hypothetical protein
MHSPQQGIYFIPVAGIALFRTTYFHHVESIVPGYTQHHPPVGFSPLNTIPPKQKRFAVVDNGVMWLIPANQPGLSGNLFQLLHRIATIGDEVE